MTGDPTQGLIEIYCRELKLPGLRKAYKAIARDAVSQNQSYPAFLSACLAQEMASRREHRLTRRQYLARFPGIKTLDGFDFLLLPTLPRAKILALAEGSFIRQKENVICLGDTGTGKTHLAIALGLCAIQAGYRVRFIPAVTLAQELLQAQQEYRLPRYLKTWRKVDLVILDELGYLGLGPGGPLLFQFCAERYELGSILITTNLDFARWTEVFGDATLTAALLDRLTHHAHVLLFQGESHRFRESRKRLSELYHTEKGDQTDVTTLTPDQDPVATDPS
ncbi:MAG: IS21-like element helper ATPase IstB [Dehalococcoidia bacterium]|nr:IS21-like element helper ATPase IstB [Dehalococcoidia bacterium]